MRFRLTLIGTALVAATAAAATFTAAGPGAGAAVTRAQALPAIAQHVPAAAIPATALGTAVTGLQDLGNGLCANWAGSGRPRAGQPVIQSGCKASRPWRMYFSSDYNTLYFRPLANLGLNLGQNDAGELVFVKASDAAHSRAGHYDVIRTGTTGHYKYWFGLAFYPNKNERQYDYWMGTGRSSPLVYLFTVPMSHLGYFGLFYCDQSCHPQAPGRTRR
jgi:hypothetical protein